MAWSDSAPWASSGIDCGTAGVSSVAVNEREYTALTASCSHAAGPCGQDIKVTVSGISENGQRIDSGETFN